jgi:hypothetical protein
MRSRQKKKISRKGKQFKFGYEKKIFEEKICRIVIDHTDTWMFKEVKAKIRGDWGYHSLYHNPPLNPSYTIFHVPSGFKIHSVVDEREAKKIVKKLHLYVDKRGRGWNPTQAELAAFINWHHFTQRAFFEICEEEKTPDKSRKYAPNYEKRTPDDWADDIPF